MVLEQFEAELNKKFSRCPRHCLYLQFHLVSISYNLKMAIVSPGPTIFAKYHNWLAIIIMTG